MQISYDKINFADLVFYIFLNIIIFACHIKYNNFD